MRVSQFMKMKKDDITSVRKGGSQRQSNEDKLSSNEVAKSNEDKLSSNEVGKSSRLHIEHTKSYDKTIQTWTFLAQSVLFVQTLH